MRFEEINIKNLDSLAGLFTESFNAPPWNDEWTKETASKRLALMLDGEAAYGMEVYEDGELCGMVLGCFEQYYDGIVYDLREFCVKNSLRGTGLGTKIFSELESRLREKGVKEITLNTLRGVSTEGFYTKCGMSEVKELTVMNKNI